MRTAAQTIGAEGEEAVARWLRGRGWTILGRNVRVGRAEIDILALDASGHPELVAVEVRWRARRDFGLPEETVDRAKLARVRAAAMMLRDAAPPGAPALPVPRRSVRVDVVAIEPGGVLRHYRAVG